MTQVTSVTGLTADRMIEMEAATIIDGDIQGNNLHLQTRGGTDIDAGNVRGPQGNQGTPGTNGTNGHDGTGAFRCTSTTHPIGLVAADNGYQIYETDTGIYKTWTGTRWKYQERINDLFIRRPGGLVAADNGVYFFATDLGYGYLWTGTRWAIDNRIICTSATRPTGLGPLDEGSKIYETDTDSEYTWTGATWFLTSWTPHKQVINQFPSVATNNAASSYQDFWAVGSGGPLQIVGFQKQRADTVLQYAIGGSGYVVNNTGHRFTWAINDGATDREIMRYYDGDPLGTLYRHTSAELQAPVQAAGLYTITARHKTDQAGATAFQVDTNTRWYMSVAEMVV